MKGGLAKTLVKKMSKKAYAPIDRAVGTVTSKLRDMAYDLTPQLKHLYVEDLIELTEKTEKQAYEEVNSEYHGDGDKHPLRWVSLADRVHEINNIVRRNNIGLNPDVVYILNNKVMKHVFDGYCTAHKVELHTNVGWPTWKQLRDFSEECHNIRHPCRGMKGVCDVLNPIEVTLDTLVKAIHVSTEGTMLDRVNGLHSLCDEGTFRKFERAYIKYQIQLKMGKSGGIISDQMNNAMNEHISSMIPPYYHKRNQDGKLNHDVLETITNEAYTKFYSNMGQQQQQMQQPQQQMQQPQMMQQPLQQPQQLQQPQPHQQMMQQPGEVDDPVTPIHAYAVANAPEDVGDDAEVPPAESERPSEDPAGSQPMSDKDEQTGDELSEVYKKVDELSQKLTSMEEKIDKFVGLITPI